MRECCGWGQPRSDNAAHRCAIGVGHIADKIEKLGALPGVEVKRVF